MSKCKIKHCDSEVACKQLCNRHYIQVRKYGRVQTKTDMAVRYAARSVSRYWLGKKMCASTIEAVKKANTGRRAWNYNGGAGTQRHQAMGKIEYKQWRDAVFAKDNYTCQVCEQHGGVLHADHIEKWSENEELRYSVNNGRTLCVPCHYYITFKRKMKPGMRWCNFTARERG